MSQGKFVWYELMTSDTKAAEIFYGKVLGWTGTDPGVPGMSYTIFNIGGVPAGGMMAVPQPGMPSAWLGYVAVDDTDLSAAKAAKDGGAIHHGPMDIPGVGRFALIADPQGAVFAMIKLIPQPDMPPPPPPHTPGYGGWRELHTTDHEAAFAFYEKQFGWAKGDGIDMGPLGIYQVVTEGDVMFGGMMSSPEADMPHWLYYFSVAEINEAKTRVQDAGGKILNGPHQVPGGIWILQCLDPQGALFALVGPNNS